MAEAAGNPPEREGERPMVKGRNATDPDEMMGAQMEVTTAVEMETMSLAGADDPRPHHDATNLQRGQCPAHSGSVRGKKSKPPPLPRTAADLQLWLDSVANAVTACAVNPETSFEWIARTEDDDVDFDDLGVTIPEFMSLDAKLRAALTKNAASTDNDKQLVNTILAK